MNLQSCPGGRGYRAPARVNPVLCHPDERRRSLDGPWQFRLDPEDEGMQRGWFRDVRALRDTIRVPGCWQGQGFGHEGEDEIWDFRIGARTFRRTYRGTGWYGKVFRPPEEWRGRRLWLNLGGVHPSADVWLNGRKLGSHSGPFVPFSFDITRGVAFGEDNFLAVRVHEAMRWLGLSLNWQGNWSGLYRSVELSSTGSAWLDRFWACPEPRGERIHFRVRVDGVGRATHPLVLRIQVLSPGGGVVATTEKKLQGSGDVAFRLGVPSPSAWSPDHPDLYRVDAALTAGNEVLDATSERVGFVRLSVEGKHVLINGEPYYLRGSGDFAINPETGSPDTSRERWRRKLSTLRSYGYNYVRCQSYVPTPEYLDAADEVGLLIQSEMGTLGAWGGSSSWHIYAWPKPTAEYSSLLKWQWNHTVMRDICRPSTNLYCMSNELGSGTFFPRTAWQCYRETKALKPSSFVLWTDGGHNEKLPGEFLNTEASADEKTSLPVVQHEFRWWSSYPDVRQKRLYTGAVRPYAIEMAERAARRNGMDRLLPAIAENSQELQYVEARTKLERCRRDNPRLAGICHFTGTDCGLSPQGVIGEFYQRKVASAATWRQTMGDTAVLMDQDFDSRVLVGGQSFRCRLLVSDFSHPPLRRPELVWEMSGDGFKPRRGNLRFRHRPFVTYPAGSVRIVLPNVGRPVAVTLQATLREGDRSLGNQWRFWVFPGRVGMPSGTGIYGRPKHTWIRKVRGASACPRGRPDAGHVKVLLTERIDEALVNYIRSGGRAVLAASEGLVRPFGPKLGLNVGRYFFLPPANYGPFEDGHSGTIVRRHPMLGAIPHEGFADLQLYRLIAESPPLDLKPFEPCGGEPVIRAISTYFVSHPLAYLAEFRLGKGILVISALDLNPEWPEARYLLAEVLGYVSQTGARPRAQLTDQAVQHLLDVGALP